jgi:hypothetical protein
VYSARVRGYELNLFFYNYKFIPSADDLTNQSWSLPDALLDHFNTYVVDKSIVKLMLAGWIPMLVVISLGSVDIKRYLSKVIESIGTLILIGAIVGLFTVPPTPAFVLQKPQCYDAPRRPPTFLQFISISESCNNQIFSLYSVLIVLPIMMNAFYVRYGPVRQKIVPYLILVFVCGLSMFAVIATRQQYVVDVYIGVVITVLYSFTQSAAFKLLFRFGTIHPGFLHAEPVILSQKILPVLGDCNNRFELFFMASEGDSKFSLTPTELDEIAKEFNYLLEAVEYARNNPIIDAKEAEKALMSSGGEDEDSTSVQRVDRQKRDSTSSIESGSFSSHDSKKSN